MMIFFIVYLFSIYLLISYDPVRSGKTTIVLIGILAIIISVSYSNGWFIINKIESDAIALWIIFFCIRVCLSIGSCLSKRNLRKKNLPFKPELFPKRHRDLQRLKKFLETANIIGLDAKWGMGKTFLLSQLQNEEDISQNYYIIEISVLTCKVDQLIPVLFHELDKVLKKDGILSLQSESVNALFDSQKDFRSIINFFLDKNEGAAESLKKFKIQLGNMRKDLIIIYEDLDRIDDDKIIKQILAINERLSNSHIKIIYQYDYSRMASLGIDINYLEKYIPYSMKLTELDFLEIVVMVLCELKVDTHILSADDLKISSSQNQDLLEKIQMEQSYFHESPMSKMLEEVSYTPRNIRLWIEEIISMISGYDFYKNSDNKKLLIRLLYLKHILPDCYIKISSLFRIYNELKYSKSNCLNKYYLSDIIKEQNFEQDRNEFLSYGENRKIMSILDFLEYQQIIIFPNNCSEMKKHLIEQKNEEYNLKLDRIYHNIISAGNHPETNRETIIKKIKREVLTKDLIEEQYQTWEEILGKSFYLNERIDGYTTINYFGHSYFEDVLDASHLVPFTPDEECKLLNLFNEKRREKNLLTWDYFRVVRYASLQKDKVFSLVMRQIANLKVVGNFLSEDYFTDFMSVFIRACVRLGYLERSYYDISIWKDDKKERYSYILLRIDQRVKDIRKRVDLSNHQKTEMTFENICKACKVLNESIRHTNPIKYNPININFSYSPDDDFKNFLERKKNLSTDADEKKQLQDDIFAAREKDLLNWDQVIQLLSEK